jgi:long-chain acyl-CoA synthetase
MTTAARRGTCSSRWPRSPSGNGQTATAEELIGFCRSQMAAYKYPRQIEFLDELPKTVSGKLLRRELRARD